MPYFSPLVGLEVAKFYYSCGSGRAGAGTELGKIKKERQIFLLGLVHGISIIHHKITKSTVISFL